MLKNVMLIKSFDKINLRGRRMKKVLAVVLCILTLTFAATGCTPTEDPYEGLYGVYNMVEKGTEVYSGGEWLITGVPYDVAVYIADIKTQAGKTIEITKDKIKFSGGTLGTMEFDYWHRYRHDIAFDRDIAIGLGFDFFMGEVLIADFKFDDGTIYQLETRAYPKIDGVEYYIRFFYLK